MKVAVLLDSDSTGGGINHQYLSSAINIKNLKLKNVEFEFITLNNSLKNELIKNNINYSKFEWHKSAERHYKLSKSNIINLLLQKLNFKNPFIKFLEKKKIDLIFFLGPTNYINYCGNINFISNVYDLNHIFFNYFPEYRSNDIIEETNHLIKRITNRSFCILANTEKTKQELITLFNCPEDKIKIYPYDPYLPKLFNKIKKNTNFENLLDKINIKENCHYYFYPAQFWPHKNHKYLIDAASILKNEKKINFKIILCGYDKKNLNYVNSEINANKLEENFIIFNYLENEEVIALYLKAAALIMPTYVGRSSLPLYEAFFFKVPIFYSKGILDQKLENLVTSFDLNNPRDLSDKLYHHSINKINSEEKVKNAYKYYIDNLNDNLRISTLTKLIEDYEYFQNRWKNNY
jgi:glycosyltransferase involved in cell wall biosynthesis